MSGLCSNNLCSCIIILLTIFYPFVFLIVCVNFTFFADFFQSVEVRQSMINILFVYAKIHPDISYKQVTGIVFLEKNDVI